MGNNKNNTIAISGAGGFIGSHLSAYFRSRGMEVIALPRHYFTDMGAAYLKAAIEKSGAVINLAGAPINHRWTNRYKKVLFESRINTTRLLAEAIRTAKSKPEVFFSASAVGYYSAEGCNTETDYTKDSGFLGELCRRWENAAQKAEPYARTVIMRFAPVLADDGGVLRRLNLPARLKVATVLGDGSQYFPWIDLDDLVGAVDFIRQNENLSGVFNFVAPEKITNREFTQAHARAEKSWLTVKVPRFVFKAALGEAASFLLSGQCVVPQRLIQAGYEFKSPDIRSFFNGATPALTPVPVVDKQGETV